jgi:hypothetical protein
LGSLEEVIGVLATWIRMEDVTDSIYDDSLASGYDDRGSWVVGEDNGLAVRVDPLVTALVRAAEEAANDRLPRFVRDTYGLSIDVRPILLWEQSGRLPMSLTRRGDTEPFDAERAAAGLRTWIAIAVLEAAAILEGFASVAEFLGAGDHDWNYEGDSPEFARPPEVEEFASLLRSRRRDHGSAVACP